MVHTNLTFPHTFFKFKPRSGSEVVGVRLAMREAGCSIPGSVK